jgi:hypothetical protein
MTDPTSLPPFPSPGEGGQLRRRVVDALLDEGMRPRIDEDGDVAVAVQGQQLFVRCLDTVPAMMRVFGQWLLDDSLEGDELTRLRAANAVTSALNLVKVTVHGDRLSVAVDLLAGESLELRPLLVATLDAVLGSVRTWDSTVAELSHPGESDGAGPGEADPGRLDRGRIDLGGLDLGRIDLGGFDLS